MCQRLVHCEPLGRVQQEQSSNQLLGISGYRVPELRLKLEVGVLDLDHDLSVTLLGAVVVEGGVATQQHVHHYSDGPHVHRLACNKAHKYNCSENRRCEYTCECVDRGNQRTVGFVEDDLRSQVARTAALN